MGHKMLLATLVALVLMTAPNATAQQAQTDLGLQQPMLADILRRAEELVLLLRQAQVDSTIEQQMLADHLRQAERMVLRLQLHLMSLPEPIREQDTITGTDAVAEAVSIVESLRLPDISGFKITGFTVNVGLISVDFKIDPSEP